MTSRWQGFSDLKMKFGMLALSVYRQKILNNFDILKKNCLLFAGGSKFVFFKNRFFKLINIFFLGNIL